MERNLKASIITLVDDVESRTQAQRCKESCIKYNGDTIDVNFSPAVTPDMVDDLMDSFRLEWTWPWEEERLDIRSGLNLHPYTTADPQKRVACFLSHYWLWSSVVEDNEPMIILEQDAIFTTKFGITLGKLNKSKFDIVGLNDPRGATRKSAVFHSEVESPKNLGYSIIPVPSVDDQNVPQGLAGNSAYFIKPEGARKLMALAKEHGAWPNDALMCQQLMPGKLGVTTTYFTRVQGTASTTTL